MIANNVAHLNLTNLKYAIPDMLDQAAMLMKYIFPVGLNTIGGIK